MAICPFATWEPLPANSKQARMTPRLAIVHTAVDAPGPTDLYGWFVQSGLESHFFLRNNGGLLQYMDTHVIAEANYKANGFAVSIETEDDGNPRATPWNPAQLATLIRLLDWLCKTHPTIPRRQADRWDGAGIGWHSQWGLNTKAQPQINPWTSALGKDCPGAPRIAQMRANVIPGVGSTPAPPAPLTRRGDSMLIQGSAKKFNTQAIAGGGLKTNLDATTAGADGTTFPRLQVSDGVWDALEARTTALDAIPAKLDALAAQVTALSGALSDDEANIIAVVRAQSTGGQPSADQMTALAAQLKAALGTTVADELGRRLTQS